MATASNHPGPHSHVQWAPSRDPSSQPSLASLPSWPLCKPSLHHHTLHHRVRISIPPLQDSPSPSCSFAPPTLRTFLSVPSPSWPPWRPPRSMCPVRSLASARRPPWKGSSTDLQGRGSSSHHQYSARGSQHPHLVQSRRPSHRGYCQWVTHVGGKPVSSRYHLGIAPHQVRWAQVTGRNLCRRRIAGCTKDQGEDLPRTSTQPAMSFGGLGHRSRG